MKQKTNLITGLLLLASSFLYAQSSAYKNEFGFRSDNDSYLAYGQDRYYTNGISIQFRSALDQSKLKGSKLNKVIWELEAGQKMYNPQSGSITNPMYIDRPFAAYLYGGAALNFLFNSESNLKLSLQLGTIGPSAKGKEAQELLHNTFGFYEINGWQWQVNNEPGINSTLEYNKFLKRSASGSSDFGINSYLHIGNTFAGAGLGILFRTGTINPLFNSVSTQSTISNKSFSRSVNDREFFFYAKPMLHYVAYDATIQGGLFRNDKEQYVFDVKPLVFSQQAGFIYSKNRWTVDFSLIFKSREVKSFAKPHQYGSVSLLYRFNKE